MFLPAALGGGADYAGLSPTKFVRSAGSGGSNSNNGNSEATAYATMAFAASQMSAGQICGLVDAVSETFNWAGITGGSAGSANHKVFVAKTSGTDVTGTASGTNASARLTFIGMRFKMGSGEWSVQDSQYMVFQICGWSEGGGTSSGNVVQLTCGSNQAYHGCYGDGSGGRYSLLAFQCDNVLFNECVVRTEANVWGPPASNPTGGFTIYSSTNSDLINCVAVDCLNQGNGAEWLGGFNFVANVGVQSGINARQCIVRYLATAGLIGIQLDGANACSVALIDTCSVDNDYGCVMGTHMTSSSVIPVTNGEYSGNNIYGIADFGSSASSANGVNTSGNGTGNLLNVSGSGNTTNAKNMAARIGGYKRYGSTFGLLRGETGWNTPTSENVWDSFPNQSVIRSKFAALPAGARGFCSGSNTLTSWIKA